MNVYRIEGTFPNGSTRQSFTQDIVAEDEADALHRIYSGIGSRHRAPRRHIEISSMQAISPSDSTAAAVNAAFQEGAATSRTTSDEEE